MPKITIKDKLIDEIDRIPDEIALQLLRFVQILQFPQEVREHTDELRSLQGDPTFILPSQKQVYFEFVEPVQGDDASATKNEDFYFGLYRELSGFG